jgi:transcriptional regulator with XRE-family HTH domain
LKGGAIMIQEKIAGMIKEVRRREGLSQAELGKAAEITQAGIARLEAGNDIPRLDLLTRLLAGAGYELRLVASKKSAQIETTL